MIPLLEQYLIKNRCEGCNKFLLVHQKIASCKTCDKIVHSQCAVKFFNFDNITSSWGCGDCLSNNPYRYNPFATISYNKHDPIHLDEFEDVIEMKKIFESCKNYSPNKFNQYIKSCDGTEQKFTTLFYNIDGNASNFDTLLADISRYKHTFSIIGIAETNTDADCKDLYQMPGYNSDYNEKMAGKSKGSGVALYIRENLIYTRIEKLCTCTQNLESLFINVTNTGIHQTVGVLYRPPGGNKKDALTELEQLFFQVPDKTSYYLVILTSTFLTPQLVDSLRIPFSVTT